MFTGPAAPSSAWFPILPFFGKPHPVDCWYTARTSGGTAALVNNGKLTCESGA